MDNNAMNNKEIILPCPACGKRQTLALTEAAQCARCQCDLTRLREIAGRAQGMLRSGQSALNAGRSALAMNQATAAWALRHTPEGGKLGFLAAAACEDLHGMRRWLTRMGPAGGA